MANKHAAHVSPSAPQAKTIASAARIISEGYGDGIKKRSFFSLSP